MHDTIIAANGRHDRECYRLSALEGEVEAEEEEESVPKRPRLCSTDSRPVTRVC